MRYPHNKLLGELLALFHLSTYHDNIYNKKERAEMLQNPTRHLGQISNKLNQLIDRFAIPYYLNFLLSSI